jgi:glycosyltransferase involved in cell wall biosynthesis
MLKNETTSFKKANEAARNGRYLEALEGYQRLQHEDGDILGLAASNTDITIKRITTNKLVFPIEGQSFGDPNNITSTIDRYGYDLAVNEDPWYPVFYEDCVEGWHELTFVIVVHGSEPHISRLYFDVGGDYNERDSIQIPFKSGIRVSRVFSLKQDALRIRFDPIEQSGRFCVASFSLQRITQQDAFSKMESALKKPYHEDVKMPQHNLAALTDPESLLENYESSFRTSHKEVSYAEWIKTIEYQHNIEARELFARSAGFDYKPKISILVPVYNTPLIYLKECIESVLQQTYLNWELCLADDASPNQETKELLRHYSSRDSRIKVCYRNKNGHISEASNSALAMATGEFIALLDHDDVLSINALLYVVDALQDQRHLNIIYTDEDKIDDLKHRFEPHFKSDWNPDLLFSQNYISHLGVYRSDIIRKIGGFRKGYEGSQDHDLLLRCSRHSLESQIYHIPRILYHWRVSPGSTASASDAKSYTSSASINALQDFFTSGTIDGVSVEIGKVDNTFKITWPIPASQPKVTILIPTKDKRYLLESCVSSILEKTTYKNYEIVILDNASIEEETFDYYRSISNNPRVQVLSYPGPFNFSAINNYGVSSTKSELVALVNNDIEVISEMWLDEMVSHAIRPDIGCVGAKLLYSNDTIQHAGVICSIGGVAGHSHKHYPGNSHGYFSRLLVTQNVSAVTAACLVVQRAIYNQVGGLNETNLTIAFNDVDFCLKVREAGYRNIWTPYAELYHHESVSRGAEDSSEKQLRFLGETTYMKNRWFSILERDPYYNINLTKEKEDFSLGLKYTPHLRDPQ